MTFLFRDKSSILFLLENEQSHLHKCVADFRLLLKSFFYYLLLQVLRCRIKQKSSSLCFLGTATPKINT